MVELVNKESAFGKIKCLLLSKPVLKVYNPMTCRTELHTDASSMGLAAMLFQRDKCEDPLRLVYAISRSTNDSDSQYHLSRLELKAIAWALERLQPLLIGIKFFIYTDCESLVHINSWKTKNAQISRWMSQILEHDLEVIRRRRESMQHVNALSRDPVSNDALCDETIMSIDICEDEVLILQRSDVKIMKITNILEMKECERIKTDNHLSNEFILRDGILYKECLRNGQNRELFVAPNAMRKSLVIRFHDCMSHFGIDMTVNLIERNYYFPRLRNYVRVHIKNCLTCILAKKKADASEGELHPIAPERRPFDIIHTDHLGQFPTSSKGKRYVLGIIDNLTKFISVLPVKSTHAEVTVKDFDNFVNNYGAPNRIISDRETSFTAHVFQEFCFRYAVKNSLNSSRHPRANGLIERLNGTLLTALRA